MCIDVYKLPERKEKNCAQEDHDQEPDTVSRAMKGAHDCEWRMFSPSFAQKQLGNKLSISIVLQRYS